MWQTPVADDSVDREKGKFNSRGEPKLSAHVLAAPSAAPADPSDAVNRVHRLKALGNGIVPAVAHIFAAAIAEQLVALDADLEVAA